MVDIKGIPKEEYFAPGHNACLGCGEAIAIRHILKAAGEDVIIVQATGCPEVYSTVYPLTSWRVPWIHVAFENAAAVASGVIESLKKQGKKTKVIAIGGDGGTYDIGLQALSGAAERGNNFLYICLNNSAYMNTGVQRSGATPKYAATTTSPAGKIIHGKMEWKKPLPLIMAAHNLNYVATASINNPIDLINKVRKGLQAEGLSYLEILCSCVPGWGIDSSIAIKVCDLAVKTNIFPLFEIEKGIVHLNKNNNTLFVKDFLKCQERFKHLTESEIKDIQNETNELYNNLLNLEKLKAKI